ncbi:hypothetical protein H5410_051053 [Solanum commersonii]|uniref:Uncharacterized protein n=1 Tax=Solanum commersonii TaxID=4109 RepID=A0A9J5WXC0_SOLCO|nr:hypothetical protein H5410_051053 [Solanum commersonii]
MYRKGVKFFSYEDSYGAYHYWRKHQKPVTRCIIRFYLILKIYLGGEARRNGINTIGKMKLTQHQG